MSDEPFPIEPVRTEHRARRHTCNDSASPVLTADEARARARQRLEDWRASHGD